MSIFKNLYLPRNRFYSSYFVFFGHKRYCLPRHHFWALYITWTFIRIEMLKCCVGFETQPEYLCVSAMVVFFWFFFYIYPQESNSDICTVKFVKIYSRQGPRGVFSL